MGSQINSLEKHLCVYLVISSKYKSENELSEDFWECYNKCVENNLTSRWVREEDCMKLDLVKTDLVVMETFEGKVFEFLEKTSVVIVGVQCLLHCFLMEQAIPDIPDPVFSLAMKDLVICLSGFTPEVKERIGKKIGYMGGFYLKSLRDSTTHLVTDSVMTVKYEKAAESGIAIYTTDWIEAVWKQNLKGFVKATDSSFDRYKCPVFKNLVVTTTNLDKAEKEKIRNTIVNNGGEYMGPLDGTVIKILLAKEYSSNSSKLKFAIQNNIPCLKIDWVYKSVEAGYALPVEKYSIKPTVKVSTPNVTTASLLNLSTISNIPNDNDNNMIDETSTTINSTSSVDFVSERINYINILDKINVSDVKEAGPFLDGCNIYLAGFLPVHRDKINKILNIGNATRYNDISDSITHFLIGDPNKATNELKYLQSKGYNPHIVMFEWLEESIKLKKTVPEEPYLFEVNNKKQMNDNNRATTSKTTTNTAMPPPTTTDLTSPLSKKNFRMLQKGSRPPVPRFHISDQSLPPEPVDEEPDVVQQYIRNDEQQEKDANSVSNDTDISSSMKEKNKKTAPDSTANSSTTNDNSNEVSQLESIDQMLFEGMTFLINSFHTNDSSILVSKVTDLGGKIVTTSYSGIPDFGIVPFVSPSKLKYNVKEIITELFIEDCLNNEKFLDVKYYHRPISIPDNFKPLNNCVIAISSYVGIEREYFKNVISVLGGHHEEKFARKTNIEKQQRAATHLLCDSPAGNKYKAALKWKIPVVTSKWLIDCVQKLDYVNEEAYLVGESVLTEEHINNRKLYNTSAIESSQPTPKSSSSSSTKMPETVVDNNNPSSSNSNSNNYQMKTPIVNKHLQLNDSIMQSPFHISTPSSPLGAMFKDNPSPKTRKNWAKWIDNLPEFEPPVKQRRLSTPISEFKRRIWAELIKHNDSSSSLNNSLVDYHETQATSRDDPAINRQLSYTDDEDQNDHNRTNNQEINEKLEKMNKALKISEKRTSSADSIKVFNEPSDNVNKFPLPETQPESVGWEDPKNRKLTRTPNRSTSSAGAASSGGTPATPATQNKSSNSTAGSSNSKIRKFMLSKINNRDAFEIIIKKLGGEISATVNFDPTATHLICVKPVRNEKMLGSIAAGKWVLHYSYLSASEENGEFVDEENYEWGNPKSKNIIPLEQETELELQLANAAWYWRNKLKRSNKIGAFENMVAMLIVPKEKYDQFMRLINAGGGSVVQAKPPYDNSSTGQKITHCFIQMHRIDQPIDWAMLANKGILCFNPSYLNQFLVSTYPINPRHYVLDEFKKYLSLLPK